MDFNICLKYTYTCYTFTFAHLDMFLLGISIEGASLMPHWPCAILCSKKARLPDRQCMRFLKTCKHWKMLVASESDDTGWLIGTRDPYSGLSYPVACHLLVKGLPNDFRTNSPRKGTDILFSWSPHSGDSWMYPYQRTPMRNPYISPIYPYIVGVYGLLSPRIPI